MCRDSRCQRRLRLVGNNAHLDLPVRTLSLPTQTNSPLTSIGSGRPLPTATTTATGTTTDYTADKPDTVSPMAARGQSGANGRQCDLVTVLLVADLMPIYGQRTHQHTPPKINNSNP